MKKLYKITMTLEWDIVGAVPIAETEPIGLTLKASNVCLSLDDVRKMAEVNLSTFEDMCKGE